MVSRQRPSKGYKSSIKCWWIPLEVQCYEPNADTLKPDASVSSERRDAKPESKSPTSGLSTSRFISAVAGIWDYVGDPAVLQTKKNYKYQNIFQNESFVCIPERQVKHNKVVSNNGSFCNESKSGNVLSSEVKSSFEELKNIKRQLLFSPYLRDLGNSFIWQDALVTGSYLHTDSFENDDITTKAFYSELSSTFEIIDKDPSTVTHDDHNGFNKSCINGVKSTLTDISANHTVPENFGVGCEDGSGDLTTKIQGNILQSWHPLNLNYSSYPMTSGKEATVPFRNTCPNIHIHYNFEFIRSEDCQQTTYSSSLVTESSERSSNSEYHSTLHDSSEISLHELSLEKQYSSQNMTLSSAKDKLQNVVAENRYAFAGALSGTVVSLCLHPVDTVKTIIQASILGQSSSYDIVRKIISEKGVLGLYRGIASNIASSAPISAIYTFTYESVKGALLPLLPKEYHSFAHCVAGGCSSVATSVVFTPSERIKQQMQVGLQYRNCWNALVGCLEKGGLPSLYAGWGAVLCRNIPHSIIKFYTYENLKQLLSSLANSDGSPSTLQTLICGGLSGSTAALFTTPFDVVKTRLQTQAPGTVAKYDGVLHALQEIAREEGFQGLYRGLTPRLAMYVSQGAIFFASYEFIKAVLALEVPQLPLAAAQNGKHVPLKINKLQT